MDRPPLRSSLVWVLYPVLSVAFCSPLFARPTGLGIMDWDQHLFYYAQVIKNVVEYGQPPFWSPWYCGGNVLWQNPQTGAAQSGLPADRRSLGLALAMKVNIVLHYWVGFVGMHLLLTRVIGLSFMPLVVYLASLFTLAGAHAMHLAVGHSVFLPAFYLPLMLYFFMRARADERVPARAVRPALVLALMIYNGGTALVPMTILAIAVLAVATAASPRSWRPIVIALVVGVSGAAYAAPKLLPVCCSSTAIGSGTRAIPPTHPDRMTLGDDAARLHGSGAEHRLRIRGRRSAARLARIRQLHRNAWGLLIAGEHRLAACVSRSDRESRLGRPLPATALLVSAAVGRRLQPRSRRRAAPARAAVFVLPAFRAASPSRSSCSVRWPPAGSSGRSARSAGVESDASSAASSSASSRAPIGGRQPRALPRQSFRRRRSTPVSACSEEPGRSSRTFRQPVPRRTRRCSTP